MHSVFLGLGSNLGRRKENIERALSLIEKQGSKLVSVSSFYETQPQGFTSHHLFINAAALIETPLTPEELLAVTQNVEKELGRKTKSSGGIYADRPIDIDILFYDDLVITTDNLTIPHPHIGRRAFVLEPLCEIARDFRHPLTGVTIGGMLQALNGSKP